MGLLTFLAYWHDKAAARVGQWRTPELGLHLLALACSWPGALLAQRWLQHKSAKISFRIVCRLTVSLNCVVLPGWYLS